MKGANKALHLALVGATILSSWAFMHLMFALHYAGEYFERRAAAGCAAASVSRSARRRAGANSATRRSRRLRLRRRGRQSHFERSARVCLLQSIIAFFFNTIILALTINIGAGMV